MSVRVVEEAGAGQEQADHTARRNSSDRTPGSGPQGKPCTVLILFT